MADAILTLMGQRLAAIGLFLLAAYVAWVTLGLGIAMAELLVGNGWLGPEPEMLYLVAGGLLVALFFGSACACGDRAAWLGRGRDRRVLTLRLARRAGDAGLCRAILNQGPTTILMDSAKFF